MNRRSGRRQSDPYRPLAYFLPAAIFAIYYLTAYPSITWWDSAEYSLAAATLSVAHPPGSLLLTLLGWLVSWPVPAEKVAFVQNILAGVIAAVTLGLLGLAIRSVIRGLKSDLSPHWPVWITSTVFIGVIGLGFTFWRHAIKFTPYILTPLLTVLILLVLLALLRDNQRDGPGARSDRGYAKKPAG